MLRAPGSDLVDDTAEMGIEVVRVAIDRGDEGGANLPLSTLEGDDSLGTGAPDDRLFGLSDRLSLFIISFWKLSIDAHEVPVSEARELDFSTGANVWRRAASGFEATTGPKGPVPS